MLSLNEIEFLINFVLVFSSDDAIFHCYYNGKFERSNNNIHSYIGGEVVTIEAKPPDFFIKVAANGVSLYGQRIWYKLPFEEISDLKLMCNGPTDLNFSKMCEAAWWTRSIDIYMERDGIDGDDGDLRHMICDEDARVEENVQGFVDEEEHCNSEATPPNLDDEDYHSQICYEKFKKGSGKIKLEQVFDNILAFKEAIVEYILKTGWNVKYTRWGPEKSEVRCSKGGGCPFKIYCSFENPLGKFMVKVFIDKHTCIKDGSSKVVKDGVIASLFLNDIRNDPTFNPRVMQEQLQDRYELVVSNEKCRKAKGKALKILQEEYDEQFSRLHDYKLEILE